MDESKRNDIRFISLDLIQRRPLRQNISANNSEHYNDLSNNIICIELQIAIHQLCSSVIPVRYVLFPAMRKLGRTSFVRFGKNFAGTLHTFDSANFDTELHTS